MIDSKEMLDKRIGLATSADNIIGIVLEGSFAYLASAYGASTVTRIVKQEVGDKTIRSFFWYPVTSLLKVVRRLIDEQGLRVSCEDVLMGCGQNAFSSILDAPIGKMLATFGKGNPQALVSNGPYAYTLAVRFGDRVYTKTGENSADVTFTRDLFGPAFTVGVYTTAYKLVSSTNAVVTASVTNDAGTNFIIHSRW